MGTDAFDVLPMSWLRSWGTSSTTSSAASSPRPMMVATMDPHRRFRGSSHISPAWVGEAALVAAMVGASGLGGGATGAVTGRPRSKRTRSSRSASADWYRAFTSLASAARMTRSRSGGRSGTNWDGGTGCSRTCFMATATGLSAWNGGKPVTIS